LTAAWLSKLLDRRISSDGFRVSAVGTGQMSSTVRVNFHEEGGQPESVIVKFASTDEGTRQLGKSLGHYMNEAIFFRRFGKLLEAGLPKCYGAIVDQDAFFTILLEDMGLHGGYQGDKIAGCSVEEAEMALDCLAKLQAPVLNSPELAKDPWLNAPPLITEKMFRESLPIYIKRYPPSEEHQRFLWWLADNVDNWRNDQRPPYAIFHGDARLDNFIYMKDRCVAVRLKAEFSESSSHFSATGAASSGLQHCATSATSLATGFWFQHGASTRSHLCVGTWIS
jgi:hypothetical protein